MTSQDRLVDEARYTIRRRILDAALEGESLDSDCDYEELVEDIRDKLMRYAAFQYNWDTRGSIWVNLGDTPTRLIEDHSDEEYWFTPHYLLDLDTGQRLHWRTSTVITARTPDYSHLIVPETDLVEFYDLEKEA